jgi:hypothetical protein
MEDFVSNYFCVLHLNDHDNNKDSDFAYLVFDNATQKRILTTQTERVLELLLSNLVLEQTITDYDLATIRLKKCMNDVINRYYHDKQYEHRDCVIWKLQPNEKVVIEEKKWIDAAKENFHHYKPFKYFEESLPRSSFYEPNETDLYTIAHYSTVLRNTVKELVDTCCYSVTPMRHDIERYLQPLTANYEEALAIYLFSCPQRFGAPVWDEPNMCRDGVYNVSIKQVII